MGNYVPRLYAPSSYDDHYCLKPPLLLWLATLYLSRGLTLPLAMGLGSYAGVNADALKMFRGIWSVQTLFPSLIAAVILYVLLRRGPTASKLVRWIWARGRIFLAAAAGLDAVLSFVSPIELGETNDQMGLTLLAVAFDVYFLLYVLMARRVRDTFADFPPPDPPVK